jgi:hypothetical protein
MKRLQKIILLSLIIIVFILLLCTYVNRLEAFRNIEGTKPVVVLVGDSLLRNDAYVPYGESVSDWLRLDLPCITVAFDGATIQDVYTQIEHIPLAVNTPNTTVVLSVGGNDFLQNYTLLQTGTNDLYLQKTFEAYMVLLESLQKKFHQTTLVVLNLFCPVTKPNMCALTDKWNRMLSQYASTKNIKVVPVAASDKSANGIEPTSEGGQAIAKSIIAHINK